MNHSSDFRPYLSKYHNFTLFLTFKGYIILIQYLFSSLEILVPYNHQIKFPSSNSSRNLFLGHRLCPNTVKIVFYRTVAETFSLKCFINWLGTWPISHCRLYLSKYHNFEFLLTFESPKKSPKKSQAQIHPEDYFCRPNVFPIANPDCSLSQHVTVNRYMICLQFTTKSSMRNLLYSVPLAWVSLDK